MRLMQCSLVTGCGGRKLALHSAQAGSKQIDAFLQNVEVPVHDKPPRVLKTVPLSVSMARPQLCAVSKVEATEPVLKVSVCSYGGNLSLPSRSESLSSH